MSIFLLSGSVLAQVLEVTDLSVSPSVIWLGDSQRVTVSAKCRLNNSVIQADSMRVTIQSPSGLSTTEGLSYSGGTYSSTFLLSGFSDVGTYTASVSCSYRNYSRTVSRALSVRSMELSLIKDSSQISAYMGETLDLSIDFRVDGTPVTLSKSDFKVVVGSKTVETVSSVGTSGDQKVSIDLCPDGNIEDCMNDLPEGTYDLKLTAYYSSSKSITITEKNYIKVNPPMKIEFKDSKVTCVVSNLCNPQVAFSFSETSGDSSSITADDVSARILGNKVFEKVYVEDLQCDTGKSCTIKLNVPKTLMPGTYDLFISVEKKFGDSTYTIEEPLTLQVVLVFSGTMTDAGGEIVGSAITLTNLATGQVMSGTTDSAGAYSIVTLPGEYSLEARLKGTIMKIDSITISNTDFLLGVLGNPLKYDEDHLNSAPPGGVRAIKTIAVELALPYSGVWFYVPYNSGQVNGDENNLKVYRCDNWNFEKGECSGTWSEVKAEIHTIRNAVEFRSNSTGAFIIGEQRALRMMDVELETTKAYVGDTVVVRGKIIDSDSQPVEGAQIKLSFPAFGVTSSSSTTTGGFFRATIAAPYTTGYPDLLIEASKASYSSTKTTTTLEVSMKKDLSIINVPESKEIRFNEPMTVRFKVFNSGQIDLKSMITVKVNGLPAGWYTLSDSTVDALAVSGQKEIDLTIKVTPAQCGAGCDKFYLINIEASSDEVTTSANMNLALASLSNQTASEEPGGDILNLPDITGFSIALPTIKNPYLPLTFIVILLVLILSKKKAIGILPQKGRQRKTGKGNPKLRDSVMASLTNIKREL
jgi:hypothetical protein